jgi:hypothetical protein
VPPHRFFGVRWPRPVATTRFDEIKFALFPPRFLCISPTQLVVAEESRLRPSTATVLLARNLQDLGKLHFKPAGRTLTLLFKADHGAGAADPARPPTLALELGSAG